MKVGANEPDPKTMPAGRSNSRRDERHHSDELSCDLGEVLDLSSSGMRLRFKGKPTLPVGKTGSFKLRIPEGALSLSGRAVWRRRRGLKTFEMGVQFTNVKPATKKALSRLAEFGFVGGGGPAQSRARRSAVPKIKASVDLPDYYGLLKVKFDASPDQIKASYRALARLHHPDVARDPGSTELFSQLGEAYEVLGDPKAKAMYDLRIAA